MAGDWETWLAARLACKEAPKPAHLVMPAGTGASAGLRFGGGSGDGSSGALAPHVILGHADLASMGVRSLLLLREALRRWARPERTASAVTCDPRLL